MRWIIEQDALTGRWVITSASDPDLTWHGSHWSFRDQSGQPLISFPEEASAEHYTHVILGAR